MAEQLGEALAGGVTLAAAVGFLVYAAQGTGLAERGSETYPLSASFRSAQGVSVGTDVRLAGVKVGTVSALDLNRETFRADMTIAMSGDIRLPEDSAIAINSDGLLGDNYVEIVPGGSPFDLDPGAEIIDTQGAVSLLGLLAQFVAATGGE